MPVTLYEEAARKACTRCGHHFPMTPTYFSRDVRGRFGWHSWCKSCKRAYNRLYRKTHAQEVAAAIARRRIPVLERPATKRCGRCAQEYPTQPRFFCRDSTTRDGIHSICRRCRRRARQVAYAKRKRKTAVVLHIQVSRLLPLKYCRQCDTVHPRTNAFFARDRGTVDRFAYGCKKCRKFLCRQWHIERQSQA